VDLGDFLQKGTDQVAAGYFIYGSSTMMVYTTGQGVHGFTLDPSVANFFFPPGHQDPPAGNSTRSTNPTGLTGMKPPGKPLPISKIPKTSLLTTSGISAPWWPISTGICSPGNLYVSG